MADPMDIDQRGHNNSPNQRAPPPSSNNNNSNNSNNNSSQDIVKSRLQRYFSQITKGCNIQDPRVIHDEACAQNVAFAEQLSTLGPSGAAALALRYASDFTQSHFCRVPPPSPISTSQNITVPNSTPTTQNVVPQTVEPQNNSLSPSISHSQTQPLVNKGVTLSSSSSSTSNSPQINNNTSKSINNNDDMPPLIPDGIDNETLKGLIHEALDSGNYTPLVRKIGEYFSQPDLLNSSFLLPNYSRSSTTTTTTAPSSSIDTSQQKSHAQETSSSSSSSKDKPLSFYGLDVSAVREVYALLNAIDQENVKNALMNATAILAATSRRVHNFSTPESLRYFIIVLENPLLCDPDYYKNVLTPILQSFAFIPPSSLDIISNWMKDSYTKDEFRSLLGLVQQYITLSILTPANPPVLNREPGVIAATKFLSLLHDVNESREFVPYTEFYNEVVNEKIELIDDFTNWKTDKGFSFCNYPFILDPGYKAKVLNIESLVRQRQERDEALRGFFMGNFVPPVLVFKVHRSRLIPDTLSAIQRVDHEDLAKELKVQFIGEEGVDQGGVQKEFFQLIVREIFDPKYGMFTLTHETDPPQYWFNSASQDLQEFGLIGMILGLAVYNSVILDVHFPEVVYKKLMGLTPTLKDLKTVQPQLARGFEQLLAFEGDVEEVYDRNFEVTFEIFGEEKKHELKPGGSKIPLTNENRQEYVDLYVKWLLEDSVAPQFAALRDGFQLLCNSPAWKLFRYEELELLICGSPSLDFLELEANTQYEGGFDENHPTIRNFWHVVHNNLTPEQQRKLLFFTTGSDRAPIGGLGKLPFVITRHGPDSDRLPSAHTCFNHLLLPDYSSREKLLERLIAAVNNSEGFGMM
eukprot:TRINITY_DN7344_c0_g3_i1.p1 TRINITY_DN7344_c0_g3~~TRINITY_DN7344_c0_g3_i1.p1  ORF type:complete len:862 (-),score=233.51 TRINITY_DN7344_c0_g3_i1:347-2932(-)